MCKTFPQTDKEGNHWVSESSCPGDVSSPLGPCSPNTGGLVWECRRDFLDASEKTLCFLVIQ